jgi:hypothetical protein
MLATFAQTLFTLLLYAFAVMVLGAAIFPGALVWYGVYLQTLEFAPAWRILVLSCAAVAGYFLYGLTLLLLVGVLRIVFGLALKEGEYPMISLATMKWTIVGALQLLVSNTFMDYILLTPFAALLYRLMGAKVGKFVQINSSFCADLSLLEIGDGSVIGGHATVIGHSFERHTLILKRVKIGKQVIVGLNAVVLPGVEIGDRAMVAGGAFVPKDTKIPPGTVYYGPKSA